MTCKTPRFGGAFFPLESDTPCARLDVSVSTGDLTGDGTTTGADLGLLIASWGVCP
jgi:hypothetical protein